MTLEFFKRSGKGFAPRASIRRQGQIGFNNGAINRFGLKDSQYALLGYDRDTGMIAIQRVEKEEQGAKKIVVKDKSGSLSAKSFFDYFEIPYKETEIFRTKKDSEKKLLFFMLEKETVDT